MGAIGFGLGTGGAGGSAATFSPTDISGLKLWLKADSLSLNDNDPVGSWTDSSGNSNTASQGTGGLKPLYKASIINSLPVVRFDGSDDYLSVTRNAGLEPVNITIFALVRADSTPANFSYVISKPKDSGATDSAGIQNRNGGGTTGVRGVAKTATTGVVTSALVQLGDVWDANPKIIALRLDGTDERIYLNGGLIGTSPAAVGDVAYDSTNWFIGAFDGSVNMAFDLAELLLYNTALSSTDRWKVNNYLGSRWAV